MILKRLVFGLVMILAWGIIAFDFIYSGPLTTFLKEIRGFNALGCVRFVHGMSAWILGVWPLLLPATSKHKSSPPSIGDEPSLFEHSSEPDLTSGRSFFNKKILLKY
jgi:hypothetical protein